MKVASLSALRTGRLYSPAKVWVKMSVTTTSKEAVEPFQPSSQQTLRFLIPELQWQVGDSVRISNAWNYTSVYFRYWSSARGILHVMSPHSCGLSPCDFWNQCRPNTCLCHLAHVGRMSRQSSSWHSWIRASWYNYENNQQDALYRLICYSKLAVHVSDDVFAYHQKQLNVFTVSGSVHPSCCRQLGWTLPDTVNTVKCSWWWAKTSPETCTANLE